MSLSFDNSEAGCMLFYDCHRSVPAPFLTKTYHLVNDPSTDEIVSWGHDHTTFVVWRPPEFARDLLPNYFKHNNFSSFVRQLNTYGFRKVVPDRWEFANDFFRRGERHLLCEIHRRKALQPASTGGNQQSRSLSPSTSVEDQAWGSSPISSPLPSPIPIHVVVPPPPPQQQQHRISTTSTTTPTPLMSISDENERLRKDNNLLLSEVSRLRRLYEDTIHMIQHQFKGSSPDHFTTLVSSARTGAGCQSLDLTFQPTVMGITPTPARREELNRVELSVNASRQVPTNNNSNNNNPEFFGTTNAPATYPTFQDHHHPSLNTDSKQQQNHGSLIVPSSSNPSSATITELEASNRPLPVKLFGVPLRDASELRDASQSQLRDASRAGTKRRQPEVAWDVVNGDLVHGPHDRVFLRPPPRKCLGSSSEMRSELSSRPAPWLQICATRDEGVYI